MPLKDRIKQIIKLIFSVFAYHSGLVFLYKRFKTKHKIAILMYHSLLDPNNPRLDYSPDGMTVYPKVFDMHMKYLCKHYNVISLSELIDILDSKREELRNDLCVITFDDGWKDFYDCAYPVLKRYGLPATVFLAPNYINNKQWFWEERIKYLLAEFYRIIRSSSIENKDDIREFLIRYDLKNFIPLRPGHLKNYLMKFVQKSRLEKRRSIKKMISELEQLVQHYGGSNRRLFLNWDEIGEMSQHKIDFGAHTLTHCNLAKCSEHEARHEIVKSKRIIESNLNSVIFTFAYPYGKFNGKTISIVREAGFRAGCSIVNGLIDNNSDLYSLMRINIHNDVSFNKTLFACRITKFLNVY